MVQIKNNSLDLLPRVSRSPPIYIWNKNSNFEKNNKKYFIIIYIIYIYDYIYIHYNWGFISQPILSPIFLSVWIFFAIKIY